MTVTRHEPTAAARLLRALDRRELAAYRQRAAVAREIGVRDDELLVLLHLVEHDEATHGELTALLGLSRSGMSAMLQRLEQAELVARQPHPADRRIRHILLTDHARDRLAAPYAALADGVAGVLGGFSAEEHETLVRFLDALTFASDAQTEPDVRGQAAQSDPIWRSWG